MKRKESEAGKGWGKGKVWALFMVLSLGLALALPDAGVVREPTLVYCLDGSASLSDLEREQMLRSASEIGEARCAVLCFGETVKKLPALPQQIAPGPASDLDSAMETALAILEQGGGQIALFTDGSGMHFNAWAEKSRNPVFVWFPIREDWSLVALEVPDRVPSGVGIPLSVRYRGNFRGEIHLTVFADENEYMVRSFPVHPTDGELLQFTGPPLPPGPVYFSATATGDARTENNRAFAYTEIIVPRTALLITEETAHPLARALAAQKIEVRITAGVPRLADYPVAILDNPTRNLLENGSWEDYLEQGGAILVCHPQDDVPWLPGALSPDPDPPKPGSEKTSDPPLPQKTRTKAEVELRSAAIVFVIDTSSSMAGRKLELACQAAFATICRLWSQDLIGVVSFDTEARWVIPLAPGTDLTWYAQRLATISPGGSTVMTPALEKAYKSLKSARAHIKHIIFLSDGLDESGAFVRNQLQPLLEKLGRDQITVTTIGIGKYDEVMPWIAKVTGGEFYHSEDGGEIPQMVLRDVDRIIGVRQLPQDAPVSEMSPLEIPRAVPFGKEDLDPVPTAFPVKKTGTELMSPFENFPPVSRYDRYLPRPGAFCELTAGDDPLLLHWHRGNGIAMLWNTGTLEWLHWPEYPVFWARLVRFLDTESSMLRRFSLRCLSPRGLVPVSLTTADCLPDLGVRSKYPFYRQSDLEWRAAIPLPKPGVWEKITVEIEERGKTVGTLQTAFAVPYEAEFADLQVAGAALVEMAWKTGGGLLADRPPLRREARTGFFPKIIPSRPIFFLWLAFFSCILWLLAAPRTR